ncbi:MAG: hypothetical protein Kow00117_06200 [Phototrophicales bacterium]|nr:MAG: hypothetical protein CUN56_13840 [Phototrophicales bacterium]RMG77526.1 MAG: hypothetical protein D6711_01410 [Chloroflexota bacterium]
MSEEKQTTQPEENPTPDIPPIKVPPLKDKKQALTKAIMALEESEPIIVSKQQTAVAPQIDPPWALQQFFNGEIDLAVELSERFSTTPLMSVIKTRTLGTRKERGVAELSTPDGAAAIIFEADKTNHVVQLSFTFGSMLTLRFRLDDLNHTDRTRWLELMRRDQGGLAFLWGPSRWESDYVICITRKYYTNFYAFSPRHFEAAARLTPEVTTKLLNWLETFWQQDEKDDEPPQLLTW